MARTARTARRSRTGAVAVAGLAVALMASVAACGADAGEDRDPEHRSFALEGRTLTVDSDDSALELVAADVDEVKVTRWFEGRVMVGGKPRVTWEMKDDRLKLRVECSGMVADCAARHRIEVPRGVAVAVRSDDGSVAAEGFAEPLEVRSADGAVRVSDSTGPLELHTDDGSVRALGVESRRIRVSTKDGSVKLELGVVPDRVESRSDDGSISIGLPRDTSYRVETGSEDGSVEVSVPRDEDSAHVVTAHTEDGSVKVRNVG
ncbi:DUF4097 family beta strand repeat-containing protein [Streptomyces europaeiscabiei]|uniref:DUF4097 family beta strand repeat-containing protein n=1 Tax=Streptomyces europaeiscabiei TaxID=146819 RepID=UPI0029B3398C|nr:DUF4097 family beta strand repeat-containing protein [Streptomyces europaeiscabiei]MDX3840696.1 DUF4097 family beta strand repeat-containing protein [Streptomyces europaeiscabiei]